MSSWLIGAALCIGTPAAVASAQARPPASRPAIPAGPAYVIHLFGDLGVQRFSAHESFDAVFGSDTGLLLGGGAQLLLRRGWFVEIGASRLQKTGERVLVFEGQAFPLGIPVELSVTPVEFTGGYRLTLRGPIGRSLIPYVAGGLGSWGYRETSPFADDNDNVHTRSLSYHARVGVEARASRWVGVAGELQYTRVPHVLGQEGVSKDFGEDDLGGPAFHVKVLIGR